MIPYEPDEIIEEAETSNEPEPVREDVAEDFYSGEECWV